MSAFAVPEVEIDAAQIASSTVNVENVPSVQSDPPPDVPVVSKQEVEDDPEDIILNALIFALKPLAESAMDPATHASANTHVAKLKALQALMNL